MNPSALHASAEIQPPKRHWLWPTRWRVIAGLAIALAIWGWFDVRKRGTLDPNDHWIHKTDFTVYTEAGAACFDGRDPYVVTNSRGWHYLYPTLFAILVSPLHELDTRNQVLVWFTISVLACWGCYRELMRIARQVLPNGRRPGHFGLIPTWLGTLSVAAVTLPALNCMQRGQVGVAKLYLLLLGFRLLIANRNLWQPVLGGSLLALAATLKITPIVPACLVVGQQVLTAWIARTDAAWKQAGAGAFGLAGGMLLWLLLLPATFVGWRTNLDHLGTWWSTVAVRAESISEDDFAGDSTTFRNQSLTNAAYRFGNWADYYFLDGPHDEGLAQQRRGGHGLLMDAAWVEMPLLALRTLAGCLMLAVSVRMARRQDRLGQAAAFGVACAATLIVFTIARGHYYVMLLPANVFVPLWLFQAGRPRWAWAVAIIPSVFVLTHYVALEYAGRVGVLGLGTTAWYFSTCGALLWPPKRVAVAAGSVPAEPIEPASFQLPLAA